MYSKNPTQPGSSNDDTAGDDATTGNMVQRTTLHHETNNLTLRYTSPRYLPAVHDTSRRGVAWVQKYKVSNTTI